MTPLHTPKLMDKREEVVIIKLIKGGFMSPHSKRQVVSLFPKRDRVIRWISKIPGS
jgi:hypothetical protein